jgi:serine/threonine protein kinase
LQLHAPSIEIGPTGTLKLYKSFQAYEFNKQGMTRNTITSPLAAGAAALQQSYQVRGVPWLCTDLVALPRYMRPHTSCAYAVQIAEKDVKFMRTLGQGASGLVQKAFWPAKAEFVAVKKISILERDKRHQLMNDIKALCKAPDTPGLIHFRGAYHCADRGQIAVALEYMDGGSLADVLERVGRVPEDVLASITLRVLQGLAHLHAAHTVHRDIKPANILMSTTGEPKVSDFGISAFVDNTLAQCHTFLGTVTYMSPERINGQPYSFPADIWALGLALLECATGRYPYDASGGTMQLMIALME